MDLTFLVAWQWFQWVAIRMALFMGLLTLGPSIVLLVFDLVLYAYRTIFGKVLFLGVRKATVKERRVSVTDKGKVTEIETVETETVQVELEATR
jgi:hypothetical protein